MKLKGIIPIIPTIFDEKGDIDPNSTAKLASYAVTKGAESIVYPGVASEDVHLSIYERLEIIKTIKSKINKNIILISGVNSHNPDQIIEITSKSVKSGTNMIMAMATPLMDKKYVYWFKQIVKNSNNNKIILQNAPGPRGSNLSADEIYNVIASVPEITHIKEENIPSGSQIENIKLKFRNENIGIIGGGGGRYMFEELERGIVASMPAIELLELHMQLYKNYINGNKEKAFSLYTKSLPLLIVQIPYRMRFTKLILASDNLINCEKVREPLPEIDIYLRKYILKLYSKIFQF